MHWLLQSRLHTRRVCLSETVSPCIVEADRSAVSASPALKSADSRLSLGLCRTLLPFAAMLSVSDMLLLRLRASLPETPTCGGAKAGLTL